MFIIFHLPQGKVMSFNIIVFFLFLFQGDKTLDGYQKKKYVCKLLFIFLLGHDIDFGHMEAVNLLSSNKYTEKQIVSSPTVNMIRVNAAINVLIIVSKR